MGNIAHKIAKFIYDPEREGEEKQTTSTTKSYQSYKEAFNTSRWAIEATKKMEIQSSVAGLDISGGISASGEDVLNRCVVGRFQQASFEVPQLNDVRRWACNTWKTERGINAYAMNDGMFLFELPSRRAAEHVMEGKWLWKKMHLKLEWREPTTGCWPEEIRRDWV